MPALLKFPIVLAAASAATIAVFGGIVFFILKVSAGAAIEKFNTDSLLYLFPAIVLFEFYFLINDSMAYLSHKYQWNFPFEFSEVRFNFELDNNNKPIPTLSKLLQLYPLTILLTVVGFIFAAIAR